MFWASTWFDEGGQMPILPGQGASYALFGFLWPVFLGRSCLAPGHTCFHMTRKGTKLGLLELSLQMKKCLYKC